MATDFVDTGQNLVICFVYAESKHEGKQVRLSEEVNKQSSGYKR